MNRIPIWAAILAMVISCSLGIAFGEIGAVQTKNTADNAIGNSTENASVKTGNITIDVIGNLTISASGNASVNMIFNNLTRIQCD
ncbi:MAG TPA: hypothetical protein PKV33_08100 [Methanothrix sp.]|nr:hypothetical protein [Methanothrix sp.]